MSKEDIKNTALRKEIGRRFKEFREAFLCIMESLTIELEYFSIRQIEEILSTSMNSFLSLKESRIFDTRAIYTI